MTTLGIMKARIADELGQRTDLDSSIASAISTAIASYQDESYWFNKKRSTTFSTVAGQSSYTAADSASIPLVQRIDFVKVVISSGQVYTLSQETQDVMETLLSLTSTNNIPSRFSYYDSTFWLYAIPADVYTVRIGGVIAVAEPASDNEANNPWMTYAEKLIRSRAKWELALHVLHDDGLASEMAPAIQEAALQLTKTSNFKGRIGKNQVAAMEF